MKATTFATLSLAALTILGRPGAVAGQDELLVRGDSSYGDVLSLTIDPPLVTAGTVVAGEIALQGMATGLGDAPPVTVTLASSDLAAVVPREVTTHDPEVAFEISTRQVRSRRLVEITATRGETSASATLTIDPLRLESLDIDPSKAPAGAAVRGTVRLNGPAPGDLEVSLASDPSGLLQHRNSIVVPKGRRDAEFEVGTRGIRVSRDPIEITLGARSKVGGAKTLLTVVPAKPAPSPPPEPSVAGVYVVTVVPIAVEGSSCTPSDPAELPATPLTVSVPAPGQATLHLSGIQGLFGSDVTGTHQNGAFSYTGPVEVMMGSQGITLQTEITGTIGGGSLDLTSETAAPFGCTITLSITGDLE